MKLIKPSIEFLNMTARPLEAIEAAGRTCYKSEDRITPGSAGRFVQKLLDRGHHAMIEHAWASYRVICDRGVTHEIVRHRLFSYAQESTRYCDYSGGVTYIKPPWVIAPHQHYTLGDSTAGADVATSRWLEALLNLEALYQDLLDKWNWSPQQARSVLPNALKTEIVMTGNLREWRHFFQLRTNVGAHPQMQEVANMLLKDIRNRIPVMFNTYNI